MKKNYLIFILCFLILFIMTSCNQNSGCYLIEGEFYSDANSYDSSYEEYNEDYQSAKLVIKEIDEDTYLEANGLNVVKDISSNRIGEYYLIELFVFSREKNEYVQLNYCNLQREPHVHTIYYSDNNGFILEPNEIKNQPNNSWKYTASHKGYWGEFYLK